MKLLTVVKLVLLVKLTIVGGSGVGPIDNNDYDYGYEWNPGDGPLGSDDEDGSGDRQEYNDYDLDDESDHSGDTLPLPSPEETRHRTEETQEDIGFDGANGAESTVVKSPVQQKDIKDVGDDSKEKLSKNGQSGDTLPLQGLEETIHRTEETQEDIGFDDGAESTVVDRVDVTVVNTDDYLSDKNKTVEQKDFKDVGDDSKEKLSKNQGQGKPGLEKAGIGLFSSSAAPMQFNENLLLVPFLYLTWRYYD